MISLQSHNQVLYHLTQFTSAITPRSTPIAVRGKHSKVKVNKNDEILCEESLLEVIKNCNTLLKENCNIKKIKSLLMISNRDAFKLLTRRKKIYDTSEKSSKWRVSYISGPTFEDNKRGYPHNFTSLETVVLPVNLLYSGMKLSMYPGRGQIRHFKTERDIKAEYDRNPPLRTRIKKWFGINENQVSKTDKFTSNETAANTNLADQADIDKLRKILDDKYVKVDELQRIKVAFAEGYLAGHDQKPRGRTMKALRFVQQIVSTFLVVVLLAVLMGAYKSTTGGSMFKIQIGNRVEVDPEEIHVTFSDVKGVEEAKTELMDVVEFLRNPEKFSVLGGKLPKGVLLVGPPGTGKTLLARAVAGEAGVPFFHAAGPEFDEVLVGQGARRVRDLFKAAKERAPCVIFIDEIDSVGAKRTNSALHPYANQTINQLLSEMDGFHQNEGVIVLGATNRQQDLDKALLRPGRFDLEIIVNAPDYLGRKEILDLYLARILTRDVDADILAKATTGFTGADIENMVNQAALRAAIEGAEYVTMSHLERARDKVIMGPEGKRKMIDEEENRITAYHEGGHALVSFYTKDSVPLHKVTIIPRGQSLGHTSFLPHKDSHYMTKSQMLARMDACMGGRAAEELIFGTEKVTSGASSDFMNATMIAEDMVKKYGMSEKVGFRVHKDAKQFGGGPTYSPNTSELIDNEVKRLLQESYERAKTILRTHHKEHKQLAEALLKYETLDAEEVRALIAGKKVKNDSSPDINRTPIVT